MRAITAPTPPPKPQTTKIPTANSAQSLTTASTAMAMTTPWWRSFASRLRVPNSTVNKDRPSATQKAVDCALPKLAPPSAYEKLAKLKVTDCNCKAM